MSWSHLVRTEGHARSSRTAVAPSLLACDFSRLGEEIAAVEKEGVEFLHLDVMDGHFVRNITFGPPLVKSVASVAKTTLDTHLMIENPDRYIEAFMKAGTHVLTIHVEASSDVRRDLRAIRDLNGKAGLAFNPDCPFDRVEPYLGDIDLLLVMSVFAGFGGQSFIEGSLDHVRSAARIREKHELTFAIEIDGGISPETAPRARAAGVDIFVAGTAIFRTPDYGASIKALRG
ncbi:MAG TPA: ribulose-phosphate 3-epimerase [Candidatus Krumholzibacteria bacterium]|nr:ribulose-phosphate 3-epimerase [Candidatus Krumholzibacteria bacterium]